MQAIANYVLKTFEKHANNPLPLAMAVAVVLLAVAAVRSERMLWWQRLALGAIAACGAVAWWMMGFLRASRAR